MLGFEETNFTVNEEDGAVELCVNVTEPPITDLETIIADINITAGTEDGTAGITAGV